MISIVIQDPYQGLISDQVLCAAAAEVLKISGITDSPSLSVRITNDGELKDLNLRFRGIGKPTDVLSFGADFVDPDSGSRYLGDVVISFPQAKKQAKDRGHTAVEELQLLVIHGVLHLLGYDHDTEENKEKMWSRQEDVLVRLGISIQIEDI